MSPLTKSRPDSHAFGKILYFSSHNDVLFAAVSLFKRLDPLETDYGMVFDRFETSLQQETIFIRCSSILAPIASAPETTDANCKRRIVVELTLDT
jgi:hypothetical protein